MAKKHLIILFIILGFLSKVPIYAGNSQTVSATEILLRGKKIDSLTNTINGSWLINMIPSSSIVDTRINNLNTALIDTADTLRAWSVNTFLQHEADPIFTSSPAFGITNTNLSTWNNSSNAVGRDSANWNTAFSWGNWALQGFITASSTNTFTNKSGNILQWTNNAGYLTSVPAQSFASLTGKPTTLGGYGITDAYPLTGNPSAFISSVPAQTFASLTGKPTTLSGYGITDAYPLSGNPSGFLTASYVPAIHAVTRPINSTTFTPSATLQATLIYNIQISCTASIGGSSVGTLVLQYSTNSGSTWTTIGTVSNSNTVTLALTLNLVNVQTGTIMAVVPANALCKMVPTTSGTTTITFISGQEIY